MGSFVITPQMHFALMLSYHACGLFVLKPLSLEAKQMLIHNLSCLTHDPSLGTLYAQAWLPVSS